MEQEFFLSGYCRVLDQNRMVEVVLDTGAPAEVDCNYGSCIYEANCPIAQKIRELTEHN